MIRRIAGITLFLTLLSVTLAQDPAKPADKGKPGDPAPKPKAATGPEAMVDMILQRMDTNKDGKISRGEAQGRILENFDRIDTNKDGYLDRTELLAMARRMGQFGGPGPGGGPFAGPRPDPNDFDALDKNADGRLTREELKGTRFYDIFDKIDTNKDGKIDPKEWAAFLKSERAAQGVEPKK